MKLTKPSGKLRLLALALIAAPMAMAQDSGWYLGANLGKSSAQINDGRIANGLMGSGFTMTSINKDKRDTGYKIFGGYEFNKYFAFEGGYFDLGKFGFTATTLPAGTLKGEIKLKGLNFDAVLSLPMTEKFSAFFRAGLNQAEAKDSFTGTGAVTVLNPNPSKRSLNYKFGAGLQYDFTRVFGMRAELERYRINDAVHNKADVDLASLGVLFRFGRKAAPAPAAWTPAPAPAPEPLRPIVMAPPVRVVVPVIAKTQVYCTILDLTFEINADEIQSDDLEKLKVVGTYLAKYPETTAVIEGHTDDVGADDHNIVLSKRRAESVVDYLVNDLKIDRSRLSAVGYGDTRPIADNRTNEGKRQNRRIHAVVACVTDIEGLLVVPARVTVAMVIEFEPYKDAIKAEHTQELRRVANFLKANPSVTAMVEGHGGKYVGDKQITPELAMEVSQRRAQNVVNYLVNELGISRARLSVAAYGQTRRVAYGTTLEGQLENRRVNIIINYPKK